MSSDEQTLGKPSGNDILEGTYTLPVLIALKKQPEKIKKILSDVSDEKGITERFELFAFGSELANGFSELIDPEDQAKRLKEQAIKKNDGDEEAHVEDEDYVEALQYGLPPTGGLGFGVDRFVMMLVGKTSIREVISFTHLKPEN